MVYQRLLFAALTKAAERSETSEAAKSYGPPHLSVAVMAVMPLKTNVAAEK
jgi:hypothetical protein